MYELNVILYASAVLLMVLLFVGFMVLAICNPCHPWVHNIRDGNFCRDCGEQLKTTCECGNDVTGWNFCDDCGLAVSEG